MTLLALATFFPAVYVFMTVPHGFVVMLAWLFCAVLWAERGGPANREMKERFGNGLDAMVRRALAPPPTTRHEKAWDLMMAGYPEEWIALQMPRRTAV